MSEFDKLLQEYVDLECDELAEIADKALDDILPACEAFDPDDEGIFMLSSIILSAVGADGVLSLKERSFLKAVLELDDEEIDSLLDVYDGRMAKLADKFADSMDEDVKASVAAFILCILACDETISYEENEFIRKIIN